MIKEVFATQLTHSSLQFIVFYVRLEAIEKNISNNGMR